LTSIELAQTAKERAPDDPSISDTLGWIITRRTLSRGHYHLKEATRSSRQCTRCYHLGCLSQKREKEAARRELRKALELDPKFEGARGGKDNAFRP